MLFGTLDLAWYDTGESAAALGLRTANDKSMALQLAIGLKIFVCDNLCFAGDLIALKRKHTAGLDLPRELAQALDRYQAGMLTLRAGVSRLQATPFTTQDAKAWIYDVFARRLVPLRYFPQVVQTYHTMTVPRYGVTLWALHNAVTTHIQSLPPPDRPSGPRCGWGSCVAYSNPVRGQGIGLADALALRKEHRWIHIPEPPQPPLNPAGAAGPPCGA